MSPEAALAVALARAPREPRHLLAAAVSGGGDSIALLHLLHDWSARHHVCLHVVTVDHGLRPGSADEAAQVAELARALGHPHATLRWHWDGTGNLQNRARRARLSLIGAWARAAGIPAVALGHTQDDLAETVLLRLARGSGVDGLSAMAETRRAEGVLWLRPLLSVPRADLRAWLVRHGHSWVEDPSNEDPRFDRVKARRALAALAPLGITAAGLADTAHRLGGARAVCEAAAHDLARRAVRAEAGDLLIERDALKAALDETRARLFARALAHVAPADYPPRRKALTVCLSAALAGRDTTLAGCRILGGATIRITREFAAIDPAPAPLGVLWDGRWRVEGPGPGETRALGAKGLEQRPNWRETGRPRAALLADPGVWDGANLIAAPTIDQKTPYTAKFRPDCDEFIQYGLSD